MEPLMNLRCIKSLLSLTRSWNRSWIFASLVCLIVSCDSTNINSESESDPHCTLGTGSLAFEAISPGAMLPIIAGPQGGYHVWGSLRASGIDPGDYYDPNSPNNPQTRFDVFLADGSRIGGTAQFKVGLKIRSNGTMEHVGEPVILAISDPLEINGQSGSMHVEIIDSQGRIINDSVEVVFSASRY